MEGHCAGRGPHKPGVRSSGAVSDGEANVEVKQHSVRRAAGAYAQKERGGESWPGPRRSRGLSQKIGLHRRCERGQEAPDVCMDFFPRGAGSRSRV
jgi:hypothetical protein